MQQLRTGARARRQSMPCGHCAQDKGVLVMHGDWMCHTGRGTPNSCAGRFAAAAVAKRGATDTGRFLTACMHACARRLCHQHTAWLLAAVTADQLTTALWHVMPTFCVVFDQYCSTLHKGSLGPPVAKCLLHVAVA